MGSKPKPKLPGPKQPLHRQLQAQAPSPLLGIATTVANKVTRLANAGAAAEAAEDSFRCQAAEPAEAPGAISSRSSSSISACPLAARSAARALLARTAAMALPVHVVVAPEEAAAAEPAAEVSRETNQA